MDHKPIKKIVDYFFLQFFNIFRIILIFRVTVAKLTVHSPAPRPQSKKGRKWLVYYENIKVIEVNHIRTSLKLFRNIVINFNEKTIFFFQVRWSVKLSYESFKTLWLNIIVTYFLYSLFLAHEDQSLKKPKYLCYY